MPFDNDSDSDSDSGSEYDESADSNILGNDIPQDNIIN